MVLILGTREILHTILMRRLKVLWQFGLSVAKVQIVFGD